MARTERLPEHYSLELPANLVTKAYAYDTIEVKKAPSATTLFVRVNQALLVYEVAQGNYDEVHRKNDFFALSTKNANYPWDVHEPSTLIIRNAKGVEVYEWKNRQLALQYRISNYHDHSGYGAPENTFLFGKIFPSEEHIGIVSRLGTDVQFRSIVLNNSNKNPAIKALKKAPVLESEWTTPTSTLTLVKHLDNKPQLAIALRTETCLKLFRFDEQYVLTQLATIQDFPPLDSENDRIIFAKFAQTQYNDLLHFSTNGLQIYRFNKTASAFQKIYYSTAFSKLRGWDGESVEAITTAKIAGDEYDELVYGGIKGLGILRAHSTSVGFEFNNVFHETFANQTLRYSFPKMVQVLANSQNLELLLHTSNGLTRVSTKHSSTDDVAKPIDASNSITPVKEKEPVTIPEIVANPYHAGWLHDQLDFSSIMQPINPYNGDVELKLPIVDIPGPFGTPIRKIIQYKNIDYNNELGRGWSFPLDYIALDRQSSAFVQDHVYSLVKDNQQIILMHQPRKDPNEPSQADQMSFTIDGYPDIQILFDVKHNFWKVTIDNRTLTYITQQQFQTSVACPMWPLCGNQSRQTQTYSSRWFLSQEEVAVTKHRANYYYDVINNKTDVRLSAIHLSDDARIELGYSEDRITNISVLALHFAQHFSFHYSDNKQLLRAIKQNNYSVFDFEYNSQMRLSKIVYPNGAKWTPVYREIPINPTSLKKTIPIEFDASIYYGPDYVIIVDANLTDGRLVLHIRDPLGAPGSSKTDSTETIYALNDIKRYVVHAIENLIVVVVIYDSSKTIAILHFANDRWQNPMYYNQFPLDGFVTAGNTFVLLSDLKSLRMVTITSDQQYSDAELRQNLPANFAVKAFPHGYVTYEQKLEIFLLEANGNWVQIQAIPENVNFFDEIDNFVSSFAISSDLSKTIRKGLVADMLGNYKQAIILKAPVLRNGELEIHVRFFMLDLREDPKIYDYYTTKIPHAVMSKFNYTVSTEEKDQFTVGYRLVNKKYTLVVKKSSGPHAVALNKYMAEAKKRMAQHYRGSKEWNRIWNEARKTTREESMRIYKSVKDAIVFAIDLSQFGLLINQDGVLTGNHQITYDGLHWSKRYLDEDTIRLRKVNQSLGADYRLVKSHAQDTFKIVSIANGTTLFDMNTTKSEEIQLVVPHYVQTQPKDSPLRVYFFDRKETITFPVEEKLNRASNQIAIITTRYAKTIPQALLFRCAKYFLNPNITVVGSQTIASMDGTAHTTQYIYDAQDLQLSVDGAIFRKLEIAPGADRSRFGWYEQSVDLTTGNTVRKAYAADGQEVLDRKMRDQEAKRRQSETHAGPKRSDLERMILDVNERVPVVDLGPYRLMDEMVSYYGFEKYEKNLFGKDKTWRFNEELLKTEYNNRFLSLQRRVDKLTGDFEPLEPHMVFVVSCWIRSSVPLKLGDTVDVFTVDVILAQETESVMSSKKMEIKQRIGTWSYGEAIIDTTHFPDQQKLRFVITLAPTTAHPSIDIDHVRFSPLDMPFEAKIYESGRGEVSALLSTSGLIKQYFYNGKGKKTVVFSEHGMVEQFVTDSKVVYTRQSNRRPCVIEMKPQKSGWFGRNDAFGISHSGGSISKTFNGTWSTLALRFLYNLPSNEALRFAWRNKEFPLPCAVKSSCPPLPELGEILIFITPVRVTVWVDGVVTQETLLDPISPEAERSFKLFLSANTYIREFIEMYDPSIKVTYHSLSGQPTQVLVYDSPNTMLVREILYDEIERPVLQTKWTKVYSKNDTNMFDYYEHFIKTFDNSTLQLTGLVADLNPTCKGFPFTYTVYGKDPTENKRMQGLPGKDYTINGKYMRTYTNVPFNFLLSSLFPEEEGFHHKAVHLPGGAVRVAVENDEGTKVAKYSKVGNYEHRLTTWRHGSNRKLLQELPPMYHYLAQTSTMIGNVSFFKANHSSEQMALQRLWEVSYDYDNAKRLIRKRTPDGGIFQYIYDKQGILRFTLHKDHNETLDRVIHFTYVADDKITREALVQLNETECMVLANNGIVPNTTNFIDTLYGEYDNDPNMRYRSKFSTRRIDNEQMTEFMVFDQGKKLLKKVFVVSTINTSYSIDYEYQNDKLRSITYPIGAGDKPYTFIYDHNGHGDVTSIRESAMKEPMFEFTYNADSLMETMKVRTDGKHTFQRNFTYNEPGFLVKLEDEYLSESDQQLVGFLRNDKLYGVITDHEGSVRLVVTGGEVVAAYDYLPYGQILRRFGTDLDGQLSYLYTGQEWEPETGLYNYRARLYDPDIGRFYQMDPKEQYASPYVYAGNSPVSLVDPDGELAFAISCIIMAIIGAYIGASSAAKSWNPLEWNWKSKSLWLGMIGGALTGLSIPYNLTASIAYFVGMGLSLAASIGIMIGAGITFGYFALAASSGSWDPRNFDLSSPGTWNALLGGISTSAFIVTNPNSLISTFRSITSTLGRALFVVTHVALTVSFTYLLGALRMGGEFDVRKWDFTDPGLYYGMFDAYITASFATMFVRNLPGLVRKYGKKIETGLDRLAETEVYFRARRLMRGDWSTKLANARFFMAANAQAIGILQRGLIPIAFYSFFVTLRMAETYENSAIPGFSMLFQMLKTMVMTKGFKTRVVKPLMPNRVNAPLALRLEAVPQHDNTFAQYSTSGADRLGNFFLRYLHIPFERLFYTHHTEYSSAGTIDNYKNHYRQTSKQSTIANCYAMTHENGNGPIYATCYSERSVVTIYPKEESILDTYDTYRRCVPLTYNGHPAMSCDGQRSTLLAVQLEPPRMFEYVDGWLLLARVAPAAVREVKHIFHNLFGLSSNASSAKTKEPLEKRSGLRKTMEKTLVHLQLLYSKSLTHGWQMDWFGSMLKDLDEDVQEYLNNGCGDGNILLERLAALHSMRCDYYYYYYHY
uniref:Uncharacterized protein n=1 Tax=Anopheles culicifacies TaxID=139723 RepID=A0A182MWW9_9DIPT